MRIYFLTFLFLIPFIFASTVDVSISEELQVKIRVLNFTANNGVIKSKVELFNTGSVDYGGRVRIDIIKGDSVVYTTWSDEKLLFPSDKKIFDLVGYLPEEGDYKAVVKVYYGPEKMEQRDIKFKNSFSTEAKDSFYIERIRADDNFVKFDVKAIQNISEVFVTIYQYPKSWIVETQNIGSAVEGKRIPVKIKYYPSLWEGKNVSIQIFSGDGEHYSVRKITLSRENFFEKVLNFFFDVLYKLD